MGGGAHTFKHDSSDNQLDNAEGTDMMSEIRKKLDTAQ